MIKVTYATLYESNYLIVSVILDTRVNSQIIYKMLLYFRMEFSSFSH